jgi:hypothetical protein
MAPELALARLPRRLDGQPRVLDPMMGSGTIPVIAAQQGYRAVGFDSDPLAVIIAKTNGRTLDATRLTEAAQGVVARARVRSDVPYEHPDAETQAFIDYWFDPEAQRRLGALAGEITAVDGDEKDALWCAFSRLIVTKDAGASRARDVSHSRPHRVRERASFDPIERFEVATQAVIRRHQQVGAGRPPGSRLRLNRGDARDLPLEDKSVDIVMTSPPYLQAIDYLRGHRLSLVWMGYTVGWLRELRSNSIGTERGDDLDPRYAHVLLDAVTEELTPRGRRVVSRYLSDVGGVLGEVRRVLKQDGRATFVVADATISGQAVSICKITKGLARAEGLRCVNHIERAIPTASRYLPPPTAGGPGPLDKRMRIEHCLTFKVAGR